MNINPASLFEPLVGHSAVLTAANDLEFYGRDWCREFSAKPLCVLLPQTIEQVCAVISCCREQRLKLVPSGGRTGLSGGATASKGEVVLSLERMNKILSFDPVGMTVSCQAGVTLEALRTSVRGHGLCYPIDIASKGSSQIGGTVATNAGGIRVIRYGNTRDWVLGLTVVTGAPQVLRLNGALYKNQSGYDLRSLFIGSEGTLGVIVEAILKLTIAPAPALLALVAISGANGALNVLERIRKNGFSVQVFEYFEHNALALVLKYNSALQQPFKAVHPAYVLVEIERTHPEVEESLHDCLHDELELGDVLEVALAHNEKQYNDLMSLRERISESIAKHSFPHKNDVSVPVASLAAFLSEIKPVLNRLMPHSEVIIFGHVGDGNVHINILKPDNCSIEEFLKQAHYSDKTTFEIVSRFGGSISAEHGVGLLKKDFLPFTRSATELHIMRHIKDAFDPDHILNPGKIFD